MTVVHISEEFRAERDDGMTLRRLQFFGLVIST